MSTDDGDKPEAPSPASSLFVDPEATHLRPVSPVEPAAATVTSPNPDVQVELIHASVEDLQTPRAPDTMPSHDPASLSTLEQPTDYFGADSHVVNTVTSPPVSHTEPASVASLSRRTSHSSSSPEIRSNDVLSRVESALARNLAMSREPARSALSPDHVDESGTSLRLRPHRSLTEHPISSIPPDSRGHSPEQMSSSSSTVRGPRSRPRPGALTHLRGPSAERQARTTGNTPVQTPQLYAPRAAAPPFHPQYLHQGVFPSPYLHPAQPQPPKETSKATRDFDSFSGRKTINQYEIQSEIGKGTHGKVKLARNLETGEHVAIKIVQRYSKKRRLGKATSQEDQVKREVAILKKAIHPNVVSMIEVIDDPDLHKIYLVLEFCEMHDVKWREGGQTEILLMEHRRLYHEMNGDVNLNVPADSEDIIRRAMRRREKASKRRRAPLSRINSQDNFFWSLEYAGDSEEEDEGRSDSGPVSRTSSRPDSKLFDGATAQSNMDSASASPTDLRAVAPIAAAATTATDGGPLSAVAAAVQETSESPEMAKSWDMSGFSEHLQQRIDNADESNPQRKPSVAESSTSRLTEMMESEIDDEERRYVPLLTIPEARRAFRDGLLGLEYLHYQGIVHRDIKPENLLRKADHSVKISDFGVSYLGKPQRDGRESEDTSESEGADYEDDTELAKTVGTPAFYAPELCSLRHVGEKGRVTPLIDVWALGVVLYCLLYARLPFQASNEFVMMRKIDDEEVFISRKRLKAVMPESSSLYSRAFVPQDHRLPHELAYEDIDDELYDLLKRLFVKDPKERITVNQIKHHPWTLRDIPNPLAWQEETDPARFNKGKKISISDHEMAEAVIPLKIVERVKSVAKKVGGVLGLGTGKPTRKRGQSSASEVSPTASVSSQSLAGRRRESMQSDDGMLGSLKMPPPGPHHPFAHHEHPLSQSVTASPDASLKDRSLDSALHAGSGAELHAGHAKRPSLSDRQESVMSTTGSIKTIRQSDIQAAASIDQTIDPHPEDHRHSHRDILGGGAAALGAFIGSTSRSIMRSMSRSRRDSDVRSSSTPPSPRPADAAAHLHGEPSTALSNASAIGLVQQPAHMSDALSAGSASPIPYQSKRGSMATGVSASGLSQAISEAHKSHRWPSRSASPVGSPGSPQERSMEQGDLEFHEIRRQLAHRKINEEIQSQQSSRPASAFGSIANLSTSDDADWRQVDESPRSSAFLPLSAATSPSQRPRQQSIKAISSNSSEDHFTSGVSQSTSYPSIPSVVSANSSVTPDDGFPVSIKEDSAHSSEGTAGVDHSSHSRNAASVTPTSELVLTEADKEQLQHQGSGLDSVGDGDDDEDEDDEGDFLMMNRPKSRQIAPAPRRPSAAGQSPGPRQVSRRQHSSSQPQEHDRSADTTTRP